MCNAQKNRRTMDWVRVEVIYVLLGMVFILSLMLAIIAISKDIDDEQ